MHRLLRLGEPRKSDAFTEYGEALAEEHAPGLLSGAKPLGFIGHIAEVRTTKNGRSYGVHFKTGAVVGIVPEGRLALGMELVRIEDGGRKSGWRFVSPKLDRLWKECKTDRFDSMRKT